MIQYISKTAIMTEIRRKRHQEVQWMEKQGYTDYHRGLRDGYTNALSLINTFKVKEVDLENELDKFYGMYRKDGQTFSLEDNEECVDWKVDCNPEFEKSFAKHFFELGMEASNKAQKGE